MIQMKSRLKVADNAGTFQVACIRVYGGSKRKIAKLGEIIKIVAKKIRSRGKARTKKGEKLKALIIRTKTKTFRADGSSLCFDQNTVVILRPKKQFQLKILPRGTRIFGPVSHELRYGNDDFSRIILMSPKKI